MDITTSVVNLVTEVCSFVFWKHFFIRRLQRLGDIMTLLLLLPSLLGSLVSGSVDKDLDHRGVQQSLSLFNWQRTTFTVISDREV